MFFNLILFSIAKERDQQEDFFMPRSEVQLVSALLGSQNFQIISYYVSAFHSIYTKLMCENDYWMADSYAAVMAEFVLKPKDTVTRLGYSFEPCIYRDLYENFENETFYKLAKFIHELMEELEEQSFAILEHAGAVGAA
jgi:hypothetical protein